MKKQSANSWKALNNAPEADFAIETSQSGQTCALLLNSLFDPQDSTSICTPGQSFTTNLMEIVTALIVAGSFQARIKRADVCKGVRLLQAIAHISHMTSLEKLVLNDCSFLQRDDIVLLCRLPKLTQLSLAQCENVTDKDLYKLRDLTQLSSLTILHCHKV